MTLPNIEAQFDILGEPLTVDMLAVCRERVAHEVSRVSRLGKVSYAAMVGFSLIVGGPLMAWFVGSEAALSPDASDVMVGLVSAAGYVGGAAIAAIAAVAVIFAIGRGTWPEASEARADAELRKLLELDYSEFPSECQQFVGLCETDPAVLSYQHKLVALGRKPVYGEYLVAKAWVEGAAERSRVLDTEQAAKGACARLMTAI